MDKMMKELYISDIYPDKAQYLVNEKVNIIVELAGLLQEETSAEIHLSVMDLERLVIRESKKIKLKPGTDLKAVFSFLPPADGSKGFGADALLMVGGTAVSSLSTAFDTASTWKEAPRYGFLSDFYSRDEDDDEDIRQMTKYHLNVVQFYDWMYRHDDLVPAETYFIDPLGRQLSLKAVKNKLEACHEYGMKAMAYAAVYAASRDYFEKNRDQALYNNNGGACNLGDNWLFIMDISPGSPWVGHIIGEYEKTIKILDFDGIHMDTYGFPKSAYSVSEGRKKLVRLEEQFPVFINKARERLEIVREDVGIIFNAVSNWSVETVAPAGQDAVYIEVWDPCSRYFHLHHLIVRAKELGKKPVILAAYLSSYLKENNVDPEHSENSFLLASSVIFASGGYHILLGENNGILAHPYFVRYGSIRKEFERTVRNYYDFIVRYKNLLYDLDLSDKSMTHANGINEEYVFENSSFSSYGEPDRVWTIVKEKPGFKVINFINLKGIDSDIWNEKKGSRPTPVENIHVKALVDEDVKKVFAASADFDGGSARELEFTFAAHTRGKLLEFDVPMLEIWDLVWIEVERV